MLRLFINLIRSYQVLTRRHIRVKVMQCIYALTQAEDQNLDNQKKFLNTSIAQVYSLYLLMLSVLIELHNWAKKRRDPNFKQYSTENKLRTALVSKLSDNVLLQELAQNTRLAEEIGKRKLGDWQEEKSKYVGLLIQTIEADENLEAVLNEGTEGIDGDRKFLLYLFKEYVAPNEKLYDYIEDSSLTWLDDLPIVNTFIAKLFGKVKEDAHPGFYTPKLLKDEGDMKFASDLLSKTLLNSSKWEDEIQGKTPKWDKDRIAEIDLILLKMAITEFIHFPSIPEKVTINEYLEIAKEYSTPKSSIFINGILDKTVKEYKEDGRLKKMGRGLL